MTTFTHSVYDLDVGSVSYMVEKRVVLNGFSKVVDYVLTGYDFGSCKLVLTKVYKSLSSAKKYLSKLV